MADRGWANRICDLEAEGRLDEARELLEAHGAPGAFERLRASLAAIPRETWAHVAEMTARVRAASELPETDPKSIWATEGGNLTPAEIHQLRLLSYWPDPLKRKGRPKGKRQAHVLERLEELRLRVKNGAEPTTAAMEITGGNKHQADHLVRILE